MAKSSGKVYQKLVDLTTPEDMERIELFPFIEALLINPTKYAMVPEGVKRKHAFLTMRRLALIDPTYINSFNKVGCDQCVALDSIHAHYKNKFYNVPREIYSSATPIGGKNLTAKQKAKQAVIEKCKKFDKSIIAQYIDGSDIELRTFEFLLKIDPENVLAGLTKIEKLNNDGVESRQVLKGMKFVDVKKGRSTANKK